MTATLLALIAQLLCFMVTWRLAIFQLKNDPSLTLENALKKSPLLLLGSVLLTLLAALFTFIFINDSLLEHLPLTLQRLAPWIIWSLIALLFNSVAGYSLALAWKQKHRQRQLLSIAIVVLILAGSSSYKQLLEPIDDQIKQLTDSKGIVLQSTSVSCMAASLANVNMLLGKDPITEKDAAQLMITTTMGSSPGQLRYALNRLGIKFTQLRDSEATLATVSAPAILFIDHASVGAEAHAVTYCGQRGDKYVIWDPLSGEQLWTVEQTKSQWHGKGVSCRR